MAEEELPIIVQLVPSNTRDEFAKQNIVFFKLRVDWYIVPRLAHWLLWINKP